MSILAQHGFGDGGKVISGLNRGVIQGVVLSPKDLSLESMKNKIAEIKSAYPSATVLLDPQFYASSIGFLPDCRMGKLMSDYSAYFAPKQLKDIRREKQLRNIAKKSLVFQKGELGLNQFILPGIMIQNGLQSEGAGIAKSFLEVTDEVGVEQGVNDAWLTLALGSSCFRNEKHLENFTDEITGFGLQSKGIYLLIETSPSNGPNPWHDPGILAGAMYLSYALSEAGYNVIIGFSFHSAPFLALAGASACASGWFDTLRHFSLDRFRPRSEGGKRPTRKYLSQALWSRIGLQEFRNYVGSYSWLANDPKNDHFFIQPDPENPIKELEECIQHWGTVNKTAKFLTDISDIGGRLATAIEWIEKQERSRAGIPLLSLPYHDQQTRDCKAALNRFAEYAEISLPG